MIFTSDLVGLGDFINSIIKNLNIKEEETEQNE